MLEFQNILLSITAFVNAGVVLFVYSEARAKPTTRYFALFSLFLAFWAIAILFYQTADTPTWLLYSLKASYIAALFIVVNFYFFSVSFPEEVPPSFLHHALILAPAIVYCLGILFPGFLIQSIVPAQPGNHVVHIAWQYYIFAGYFIGLVLAGLGRLWAKFFRTPNQDVRTRTQLFAIGVSVTFAGVLGTYFNLILASPVLDNFAYLWTGPLFTFFIGGTITYTIFRYGLFQPRAIISELFIFLLWAATFTRTLLSTSLNEQIINGTMFALAVLLGILLIKSVRSEHAARERVEVLARDLEKANARLKELDRQKTEFVSIASHQLRSPLTAIKGYSSLLLEGSYGKLSKAAEESIKKIFDSSKYMAISIEDFLNVSRIELGTVKYDMKDFSLATLGEEVVGELLPAAGEKGLALVFHDASSGKALVRGDYGKLRQVVLNLVDNAMKYTPKGGITVTVAADETKHVAQLSIADTGVGIPSEVMPKLFGKFVRAKNANEVNVMGTGLGLYVAKQFVEAHHGRIWAESLGQGKGATFHVELPLKGA